MPQLYTIIYQYVNYKGYFDIILIGNFTDIKKGIIESLDHLENECNVLIEEDNIDDYNEKIKLIDTWEKMIDFIKENNDGSYNNLWRIQLFKSEYIIENGLLVY
jgi:hypothetical protein